MKGGYTSGGLWDDGGRESSAEGGTEHGMASSDGTEATRVVTGRLTQTWGLW